MSKRILFFILFSWLASAAFPAFAQQKADTTYTFRFVPQKDMFYVPWNGNDTELARLLECIENNKTTILDGKLPLLVDGYCNSLGSEAENLATAKIRANRVKSELIIRAEIKEENFITRNHATEGDFVTVRLTVPVKGTAATDAEARRKAETERLEAEKRAEQERLAEEQRKAEEAKRLAEEQRKAEEARQAELRRQEEERRIEEQKRQEELKKQEEQKRLAEEKRKAEEKAEAERKAKQEELKKQAQERERKIAEEKAQREKALAEKRKAQEELSRQRAQEQANAARRKEMLSRLTGQSGSAMGSGSGAMTNFQQAQYNNRIVACIRPHITFNTPAGAKRGMYVAKFDVRLLKNGQKAVPPKMISSSGLKAFDTAVEKAILMCNPFPKPPVGDIPSSITLTFDPVDDANGR